MENRMTAGEQNLLLLESLLPASEKLYIWCYKNDGTVVDTSCPPEERKVLEHAFRMLGGMKKALRAAEDRSRALPFILGSPIGMQWAVTFETERDRDLIFVIGPVFYSMPDERQLRTVLGPYLTSRENADWAAALFRFLPKLPVMAYAIFTHYVIMVHNTLTGERLGVEVLGGKSLTAEDGPAERSGERNRDGAYPAEGTGERERYDAGPAEGGEMRDRNAVYLAERALLRMVRTGDISYQRILQNSTGLSPGVPVRGQDPLRQMKTSIVVFTTLVSRAAMEGGLSPEVAYPLGDSYIQAAEDCRDSGELGALAHAMYHEFIYRVHRLRSNPDYSLAVQKCCDYIELSLDRKIRIADLAALAGYTEYYLSEKFKKETGRSINRYICEAKVERARVLLLSTDMPVREIAESLAFNTVNYFIRCFHDILGCSPAQYRKEHRHAG